MLDPAFCLVLLAPAVSPSPVHQRPEPPLSQVRALNQEEGAELSDDELQKRIDAWVSGEDVKDGEQCLCSLAGRSREVWEPRLKAWWELSQEEAATDSLGYLREVTQVLLLTALRRMQGRPDPLTVEAALLGEGPYLFPQLPVVGVRLLHTEGETATFPMQIGGDYRSGRLSRWDVEFRDAKGKPHGGVDDWTSMFGGGMSQRLPVGPGFVWGIDQDEPWNLDREEGEPKPPLPIPLPVAAYRRPATFGKYTLRVAYHDSATIADESDSTGRILFRSQELEFEWAPRAVEISKADEARVNAALEKLYKEKKVSLTGFHLPGYQGSKAEDAHALDHLFVEGWKAVPILIDNLQVARIPSQRAHLIAALYDLTGLESPQGWSARGAIGNYELYGGYVPAGSGVKSTPARGSGTGKIRAQAQDRVVERWLGHRHNFAVKRK